MNTNPLRRALVAVLAVLSIAGLLATGARPAAAQADPGRTPATANPSVLAILTSPDVVGRMIVESSAEVRDAVADTAHAAARLVRPRTWGERSPDVAALQAIVDLELVDGLYGPATARAHTATLEDLGVDPGGIVPSAPAAQGPTGTAPAATAQVAAAPAPTPPPSPDAAPPADAAAAPPGGPSAEQWAALRFCESSGDYTVVNPTGAFRGAYQFSPRTWDWIASEHAPHLVGVDPAAASPADQDFMAYTLYAVGGPGHWPVCGRYLY